MYSNNERFEQRTPHIMETIVDLNMDELWNYQNWIC
jgi:hypothetical protein